MAHELQEIVKIIAGQMNDSRFSGNDLMPVIAFLHSYKSECNACRIHE